MAKFVLVKTRPTHLRKDEFVIVEPNFLQEVRENASKAPRNGLTGINHLRTIVGTIGLKYDPELTAWNIKPHLFEGRSFSSDEDVSQIVVDLLKSQYPKIFERYIDHQIKRRPYGTKLIYYVGNLQTTSPFFENGIDLIDEQEIEAYLGLKPKKNVGKPAVSKEEVNQDNH